MNSKIKIRICKEFYTKELLRNHPDEIFLFGDNDQRTGHGGQAVIRDEINAIGIRVKKYPGTKPEDYYSDDEYESNLLNINADLENAIRIGKTIVIPAAGIGTGRAKLKEKAPKTYEALNSILGVLLNFSKLPTILFPKKN
jgi:hypothetical protein